MHVRQAGFTLIELIVGIVLISVALVMITSVMMPQLRQGIDPIWQVRSVTLAQSLLSEISSKAFDERSITPQGRVACNFTVQCTVAGNLGSDAGESREQFDDIDDFHNIVLSGVEIINTENSVISADIAELFSGFSASVQVVYDDNADGINDADPDNNGSLDSPNTVGNQKLISVTVTTPDGEDIRFASYRANF